MIVDQVEDINYESNRVVNITRASLLDRDSMLVDDVRLIYVEYLYVITERLAAYIESTRSKWTVARDFEKLDIVADLCKVDFLVKHERLAEQLCRFLAEAIDDQIFIFAEHLTTVGCAALPDE